MSAPAVVAVLLAGLAAGLLLGALERARARRVAALAGPRHARLAPGAARPRTLAVAAFAAGLCAALLAAVAAPAAAERDEAKGVEVVLCLDVSRSMLARDVLPDRLTRAKEEVRALSRRARGDRVALVVFAGEARLLVPRTTDLRSLADLCDQADPASVARGGTDLAAALTVASEALSGHAPAAVVLLTDGEDLEGKGERAAAALLSRGVVVHAVGFGTAAGAKIPLEEDRPDRFVKEAGGRDVVSALDVGGLRRLAVAGGGTYADGSRPGALVSLFEEHVAPRGSRAAGSATAGSRLGFQASLCAALLFFAIDLSASRRRRR